MSQQPAASHPEPNAPGPEPSTASTAATTTPDTPKPEYYNAALPHAITKTLAQTTRPPLNTNTASYKREIRNANTALHRLLPSLTPAGAHPTRDPNKIFVIIPTANAKKTHLITTHLNTTAHKPRPITLTYHQIPADSDVGEQPYDAAGPRGAFNRVVNAVRALQADEEGHLRALVDGGYGTLLVGAVENYIWRKPEGEKTVRKRVGGGGVEKGKRGGRVVMVAPKVPVDYGVVVFCVVSLVGGVVGGEPKVEWVMGVSGGVTVPVQFYREAVKYGFEDGMTRRQGKVTVGKVLGHNIPGLDHANWHEALAGVSRYDLLEEAMKGMTVPWPGVEKVEGAAKPVVKAEGTK